MRTAVVLSVLIISPATLKDISNGSQIFLTFQVKFIRSLSRAVPFLVTSGFAIS